MSTDNNFCGAAILDRDNGRLPKGSVPAIFKAVQVLDTLAVAREPLSLATLTQRLGLPKSSLLSLCNSLCETGLARRTERGNYELGNRVLDFANAYLRTTDITKEFVHAWDEMHEFHDEGVVLAVLDGTDAVYVGCRNGRLPLGVSYRIGMRMPACCTATGKALLSTLPEAQVKLLYRGVTLPSLTPSSHAKLKSLIDDLAGIRLRGYAVDDEETREGMYCIGAPVFDAGGHAIAAVAVSLLKAEGDSKRRQMTDAVQNLADVLSRRMGGSSRR
ncbi:MAG: IclR family transcriptional regulator [Betaproteobacteria bacterium]|nr:IclR family transcriptional regulator [Betaproteobacteria bacterium]